MNIEITKYPKIKLIDILKEIKEEVCLYSPAYGYMRFKRIEEGLFTYPIICEYINPQGNAEEIAFTEEGKLVNVPNAECILFPFKDANGLEGYHICKYGEPVMYLEFDTNGETASDTWKLGTGISGNSVMLDNGVIIQVYCKIPVRCFDFESRIKIND